MDKNVGGLDRAARLVVGAIAALAGVAALAGYWTAGAVVGAVAVVLGAILLVTGTTQRCPLNEAAGIDTSD
jgi:hypothetical protein